MDDPQDPTAETPAADAGATAGDGGADPTEPVAATAPAGNDADGGDGGPGRTDGGAAPATGGGGLRLPGSVTTVGLVAVAIFALSAVAGALVGAFAIANSDDEVALVRDEVPARGDGPGGRGFDGPGGERGGGPGGPGFDPGGPGGPGFGGPGFDGPGGGPGVLFDDQLEVAAEVLGVDEADLREQLADGATLAEVAEDEGVDPDEVVDALVESATERVEEAVDDGAIDEEQADRILDDLPARVDDLVHDGTRFGTHGGAGDGEDGDGEG